MTEYSIDDLLLLSDDEDLAEDDPPGEYIPEFDDDDTPAQDAPSGGRPHFSLLPVDYDPLADPAPARPNADFFARLVIDLTDRRIDALRNSPALNGRRTFRQGNRARARRWTKRAPGCLPSLVPEQCA